MSLPEETSQQSTKSAKVESTEKGIIIDEHKERPTPTDIQPKKKALSIRAFIRISGFTITFVVLSFVLIIIGIVLYYVQANPQIQDVGFWLAVAGVIVFMLTMIFGFEKIDE
jgi:cytochrome c biogenesis protein CcdA